MYDTFFVTFILPQIFDTGHAAPARFPFCFYERIPLCLVDKKASCLHLTLTRKETLFKQEDNKASFLVHKKSSCLPTPDFLMPLERVHACPS